MYSVLFHLPFGLPIHAYGANESPAGLVLLALVTFVRAWRRVGGEALVAFACGYEVLRFGIEVLRADPGRGAVGPFSTSQFIAVATVVSAAAFAYAGQRRLAEGGSSLA